MSARPFHKFGIAEAVRTHELELEEHESCDEDSSDDWLDSSTAFVKHLAPQNSRKGVPRRFFLNKNNSNAQRIPPFQQSESPSDDNWKTKNTDATEEHFNSEHSAVSRFGKAESQVNQSTKNENRFQREPVGQFVTPPSEPKTWNQRSKPSGSGLGLYDKQKFQSVSNGWNEREKYISAASLAVPPHTRELKNYKPDFVSQQPKILPSTETREKFVKRESRSSKKKSDSPKGSRKHVQKFQEMIDNRKREDEKYREIRRSLSKVSDSNKPTWTPPIPAIEMKEPLNKVLGSRVSDLKNHFENVVGEFPERKVEVKKLGVVNKNVSQWSAPGNKNQPSFMPSQGNKNHSSLMPIQSNENQPSFKRNEGMRNQQSLKRSERVLQEDNQINSESWRKSALKQPCDAPGIVDTSNISESLDVYTALYDFVPEEDGDISFKEGQTILKFSELDKFWWNGRVLETGSEGIFPYSFVEKSASASFTEDPCRFGEHKNANFEEGKKTNQLREEEERQRRDEEEEKQRREAERIQRIEKEKEKQRREEQQRELQRREEEERENQRLEERSLPQIVQENENSINGFPPEATHISLFDFAKQEPDELEVRTGEYLKVIAVLDEQWMTASNLTTGFEGLIPCNYCEEIKKPLETVTAIYDFVADVPEDLPFKAGDTIQLLERIDNNWARGRKDNREGLLPLKWVE